MDLNSAIYFPKPDTQVLNSVSWDLANTSITSLGQTSVENYLKNLNSTDVFLYTTYKLIAILSWDLSYQLYML